MSTERLHLTQDCYDGFQRDASAMLDQIRQGEPVQAVLARYIGTFAGPGGERAEQLSADIRQAVGDMLTPERALSPEELADRLRAVLRSFQNDRDAYLYSKALSMLVTGIGCDPAELKAEWESIQARAADMTEDDLIDAKQQLLNQLISDAGSLRLFSALAPRLRAALSETGAPEQLRSMAEQAEREQDTYAVYAAACMGQMLVGRVPGLTEARLNQLITANGDRALPQLISGLFTACLEEMGIVYRLEEKEITEEEAVSRLERIERGLVSVLAVILETTYFAGGTLGVFFLLDACAVSEYIVGPVVSMACMVFLFTALWMEDGFRDVSEVIVAVLDALLIRIPGSLAQDVKAYLDKLSDRTVYGQYIPGT